MLPRSLCAFETLENRRMMSVTVPLVINGTSGNDFINLDYGELSGGDDLIFWRVNDLFHSILARAISRIVINSGGGDDSIQIRDLKQMPLNIAAGAGNDSIDLLGRFSVNNSFATVDGGTGYDRMSIHDEKTRTNTDLDRYVLTSDSFKWGGRNDAGTLYFRQPTTFAAVEHLDIWQNQETTYTEITAVAPGVSISLHGGAGVNTFDVNPVSGDLDSSILGQLSIFGGAGNDQVTYFDHNDTGPDGYTIGKTSIQKSYMQPLSMFDIEQATLFGNNEANLFNIQGVHQNLTRFEIKGAGGSDTFRVGSGDLVNDIRGTLVLSGNAGDDSVELIDWHDIGYDSYTLTDTKAWKFDFSRVSWDAMVRVMLQAGTQSNTIHIVPSALTEFIVHGNEPTSTTGDSIVLNLNGVTGGSLTRNGSTGVYAFSNRRMIRFDGVENPQAIPTLSAASSSARHALDVSSRLARRLFGDVPIV